MGPPAPLHPSRHFLLHTALEPESAQSLCEEAESCLEELGRVLGVQPPPGGLLRIHHFRWRLNFRRYMRGAYPPLRACEGACFETPESYVVAVYGRAGGAGMQDILRHELTHYLLTVHYAHVQPWIDEGLARVFACGPPYPHLEQDLLKRVRRTARSASQQTLHRLLSFPPGHLVSLDQALLSCAMTYVLLTHTDRPFARLQAFLDTSHPSRTPEQTFRTSWGLSINQACEELAEWSKRR